MPSSSSCCVERAGLSLVLRADGSVLLPSPPDGLSTLLVADVHLGKADEFGAQGLPVPASVRRGVQADTLQSLADALAQTRAQRLVVMGDLFHGPVVGDAVAGLCHMLAALHTPGAPRTLTVIGGNHDTRARVDLSCLEQTGWEVHLLAEHDVVLLGPLGLAHHPRPVAGAAYTLAGHWHPCVTVQGRARDRLRLPCFWFGQAHGRPVGILPAFGGFTGMHPIEPDQGDEVFAIAGDAVLPLATAPTLRP